MLVFGTNTTIKDSLERIQHVFERIALLAPSGKIKGTVVQINCSKYKIHLYENILAVEKSESRFGGIKAISL